MLDVIDERMKAKMLTLWHGAAIATATARHGHELVAHELLLVAVYVEAVVAESANDQVGEVVVDALLGLGEYDALEVARYFMIFSSTRFSRFSLSYSSHTPTICLMFGLAVRNCELPMVMWT